MRSRTHTPDWPLAFVIPTGQFTAVPFKRRVRALVYDSEQIGAEALQWRRMEPPRLSQQCELRARGSKIRHEE
eukprot:SAG11_NODE_1379_length_5083_cov_3.259831_2_plen_73_part_00